MKHYERPMAQLIKLSVEEDLLTLGGNTGTTSDIFPPENE